MLRKYAIARHTLVPVEDGPCSVWVYVNPSPQEQEQLVQIHGIAPSDIASALDPDEVSRFVVEPDYTCVIWNHPRNIATDDHALCQVSTAGLFLSADKLVVIFPEEYRLVDPRHPLKLNAPIDVIFGYLYQTIQHYLGHLKVIRAISTELETKISKSMENEHLLEMFGLSEGLIYYLNAIISNNAVLVKLRHYCEKNEAIKDRIEILDDLAIENNQCARQAEIYSQVLSGLMDARGTLVNNNMNVLIKKLTLINVIFLPLNLLASIGGMSEYSMMTRGYGVDWRIAYSAFIVLTILLGGITTILVSRTILIGSGRTVRGGLLDWVRRMTGRIG